MQSRQNFRFFAMVTIFLIVMVIIFWNTDSSRPKPRRKAKPVPVNSYDGAEKFTNCLAPNVSPWDKVYRLFYAHRSYKCTTEQPLTTISDSGLIELTSKGQEIDVRCYASTIKTDPLNDNQLIYGDPQLLKSSRGMQLTAIDDIAKVTCYKFEREIYINTHLYIPDFESSTPADEQDRPSVIVFFLESLSAGSYRRFMPNTQRVLDTIDDFQELEGFQKATANSFPNSMAMISGQIIPTEQINFLKSINKTYFDGTVPFVWDDFKKNGYVTGYHEDMALIGVFNYFSNGFLSKPVDWMPRAYWLQMYPTMKEIDWEIFKNTKDYCFAKNGSKLDLFLKQIIDFLKIRRVRRQPFFLWSFHSQMTHTNFDDFQMVDEQIAKFMKSLEPFLNNTVILFAGDHGPRVMNFPETMLGRLEARLSFITIRIPESLNQRFPHLRRNLESNRRRLTSWIDVHAMLKDIAHEKYENIGTPTANGAINLIREVAPLNRSCRDASILDEYCVCNGRINLETYRPELPKPQIIAEYISTLTKPACNKSVTSNETISAHYVMNKDGNFMVENLVVTIKDMESGKHVSKTFTRDHRDVDVYGGDSKFKMMSDPIKDAKLVATFC